MVKLNGKYDNAIIYASIIEDGVFEQVQKIIDNPISENANTRIMPDVHVGAGICIGYTAKLTNKVVPFFIGVDVGCGLLTQTLNVTDINFETLDKVIRDNVPSGFKIRNMEHKFSKQIDLTYLKCFKELKNIESIYKSIGTLGSGNHFIEINKDDEGNFYLVIHSGSRNLGKQVADFYQNKAFEILNKEQSGIDKNMAYLEGELMCDYLHDMTLCQQYAGLNRKAIANTINVGMRWDTLECFETIHNYIDIDNRIIRKGAVSAQKDEILIIPMNMSWGSIICRGKGNSEWNYSAPHGGGRKMSRMKAREIVSMDDYEKSMNGIYSTCVNEDTIDESPMAYKDPEMVIKDVSETVDVIKRITPIYNFKAGETKRGKNKSSNYEKD